MKPLRPVTLTMGLVLAASFVYADSNARPNILWITTDDHRPDSLQCFNRAVYGTDESPLGYVESPHTDKLAEEGVLFTRAIVNAPACGPSRGSMHTGRYPFRNGHYGFVMTHQAPDFVHPIVHQTMRRFGYSTAAYGKTDSYIYSYPVTFENHTFQEPIFGTYVHHKHQMQHNGVGDIFHHTDRGYKDGKNVKVGLMEKVIYEDGTIRYYNIDHDDRDLTAEEIAEFERTNREFGLLRNHPDGFWKHTLIYGGRNPQPADKTIDAYIVREFKDYLTHADESYTTSWGATMNGVPSEKPLFIEMGLRLPHTPVLPPQSYRERFKDKIYKVPEFTVEEVEKLPPQLKQLARNMKVVANSPEDVSAGRAFSGEEMQMAIRDYYAFCAQGDELIGDAVKAFKDYCETNNRDYLIIYTVGDHGWHLGEQGIESKFGPWRESIHNAALVISSNKEKFPPGMVYDEIVEYVDFAPTILAAGGADIHSDRYDYLDGCDLSEVLKGETVNREYALGEMNLVIGPRAYLRSKDWGFSMRTRKGNAIGKVGTLNKDIKWALECPVEKAELALYDLRVDPLERDNVAADPEYAALAEWFRQKLGNIVLGDGRVECDWDYQNAYEISNFAEGADNKKLDIPAELIPAI